jgi:PadR family transcriptional regulator PadR
MVVSTCMQVEAQALKRLFHMLLLSVLGEHPMHPYAIHQALRRYPSQFKVSDAAVYKGLQRLDHLGLANSSLSVVDGRTRRTYSITPAGRDQLEADWKTWEEFTLAIRGLLEGPPDHP